MERHGQQANITSAGELPPVSQTRYLEGNLKVKLNRKVLDCPCRCKGVRTKLLLQCNPTDITLARIDNTPYGDKCFGLSACTPTLEASSSDFTTAATAPYDTASDNAFQPYLNKVDKQVQTFHYNKGVIHPKLIDRQLFTLSKVLYIAAQFRPSTSTINRLRAAQCSPAAWMAWSQRSPFVEVFEAIGATTAKTIDAALDSAVVKAAIFQHGYAILITPRFDQQTRAAALALDSLNLDLLDPDSRNKFLIDNSSTV